MRNKKEHLWGKKRNILRNKKELTWINSYSIHTRSSVLYILLQVHRVSFCIKCVNKTTTGLYSVRSTVIFLVYCTSFRKGLRIRRRFVQSTLSTTNLTLIVRTPTFSESQKIPHRCPPGLRWRTGVVVWNVFFGHHCRDSWYTVFDANPFHNTRSFYDIPFRNLLVPPHTAWVSPKLLLLLFQKTYLHNCNQMFLRNKMEHFENQKGTLWGTKRNILRNKKEHF